MTTMASQITSLTVVYSSTVYSGPDQEKHQGSASPAFMWGIHRDRWIPRTKGQLRHHDMSKNTGREVISSKPNLFGLVQIIFCFFLQVNQNKTLSQMDMRYFIPLYVTIIVVLSVILIRQYNNHIRSCPDTCCLILRNSSLRSFFSFIQLIISKGTVISIYTVGLFLAKYLQCIDKTVKGSSNFAEYHAYHAHFKPI